MKKACKHGSHWRDGCKYCKCTSDGKISCDSSGCNFSSNRGETNVEVIMPKNRLNEGEIQITGGGSKKNKNEAVLPGAVDETKIKDTGLRRFQFPPPHAFHMPRTYRKKKPTVDVSLHVLCEGKHKPGDWYYDKCNLCECTRTGSSKCTAIMCV